jgi:hypothetical protein
VLGEDLDGDLVHLEGPGGAGVGLEVDEEVDELILADADVQCDAKLPA